MEKLLGEIRLKIGKDENDIFLQKMVDKYSQLIIEKINKNNNNNNNNNNNDNNNINNLDEEKNDDDNL